MPKAATGARPAYSLRDCFVLESESEEKNKKKNEEKKKIKIKRIKDFVSFQRHRNDDAQPVGIFQQVCCVRRNHRHHHHPSASTSLSLSLLEPGKKKEHIFDIFSSPGRSHRFALLRAPFLTADKELHMSSEICFLLPVVKQFESDREI